MKKIFVLFVVLWATNGAVAQTLPEVLDIDSVKHVFETMPSFGLYKDNYFSIGTSTEEPMESEYSDVKFQISIRHRLSRRKLPGDIYMFLFYSQKTLWNVFESSLPMHDNNYNPGISFTKFIERNGRFSGIVQLMVEHESNGRDGEDSRSWNKIGISSSYFISNTFMAHAKIFVPIVDKDGRNEDIIDYVGFSQFGIQKFTRSRRWVFDVTFIKRHGWNFNFNTCAEIGARLFRDDNQLLFVQFYNGYGECMLDYNKFSSMIRVGILIRPNFFSTF
ncbi:MAG: phospholipase A [Bacteroidales bacterium]|nr:phospholipase A [Bacteroidales bacterium]